MYLEDHFDVVYSPLERQLELEEISEYAKDADIIMTGWGHPRLNAERLRNTSIRLIVHTGGSVGNLIDEDIYSEGIKVISGNNWFADSVAEGVVAYMLTALRRIPDYVSHVRNGKWEMENSYTEGLLDQTIGLVGTGTITKRVVELLKPFRVKVKLFSHYPIDSLFLEENRAEQVSMEEIFSTCKIVSIHSSLNEKTHEMIGEEHFRLLQNGAIFINTARGKLIREHEMVDALKEKRFFAVLDVFAEEPLSIKSELRYLDNVYCIPHKAGPTVDRREFIAMQLIDDMIRFEKNESMKLEIIAEYVGRMTVE